MKCCTKVNGISSLWKFKLVVELSTHKNRTEKNRSLS